MVETYLPFLLILMSWNVDDPAGSMQVETRLYLGQLECEASGQRIEELRAEENARLVDELVEGRRLVSERGFTWRCVPYEQPIEVYHWPSVED